MLDPDLIFSPREKDEEFNTYHTFVIQIDRRDEIRKSLTAAGIDTAIHYPTPIHLQTAGRDLGYKKGDFPVTELQAKRILTLPINQFLSDEQIRYVSTNLNRFMRDNA